ncbi:Disintegrin [Teladorsagia circumcincta]|uniref:Disintegrin n=1 Tax=Teladorsagia circumcincta TaxID=45464 RepID=A0A2G9UIC2_TELCI|nr:Disintegrin [Teladorsagia circumcincta]
MSQEHHRRHTRDLSKQTKYVELALIGDYEYVGCDSLVKQHGYSDDDSLTYMLEAVNIADLMFSRDLNVRLSVVYAEIWLDVQRVDLFEDIERTMSGVVDYSTGHIYNIGLLEPIDPASFICSSAVDAFGAQWSGQMLAESLGHLFGLEHDTLSCQCETDSSKQRCIMTDRPGRHNFENVVMASLMAPRNATVELLRKSGEVCRSARSACDVAETCDGKSGDCPPDGHLMDGTACGRAGARVAEQECFKQNTRGHEYANCGSIDGTGAYRSCQPEHIRCSANPSLMKTWDLLKMAPAVVLVDCVLPVPVWKCPL